MKTTKINGVELDLRGIKIDIERISPEDWKITIGCENPKKHRMTEIMDVFRSIFSYVKEENKC